MRHNEYNKQNNDNNGIFNKDYIIQNINKCSQKVSQCSTIQGIFPCMAGFYQVLKVLAWKTHYIPQLKN